MSKTRILSAALFFIFILGNAATPPLPIQQQEIAEQILRAWYKGDFETFRNHTIPTHPIRKNRKDDEQYRLGVKRVLDLLGPLKQIRFDRIIREHERDTASFTLTFAQGGNYTASVFFKGSETIGLHVPYIESAISAPMLSPEEMRSDIDYLCRILRETMPHAAVIRECLDTDIFQRLAEFRESLPRQNTDAITFAMMLRQQLLACRGHHLALWGGDAEENEYMRKVYDERISADVIKRHNAINSLAYQKEASPCFIPSLELFYLNGNYYTIAFNMGGQAYPGGMRLDAIDGIAVSEAERRYSSNTYLFDFKRRKPVFFFDILCRSIPERESGKRTIQFEQQDGSITQIVFDAKTLITYPDNPEGYFNWSEKVTYLPEISAIFIRLPKMSMRALPDYEKTITAILKEKHPRYAIIDIRHNGGGSDNVPYRMLELLAAFPVSFRLQLALPANARMRDYVERRGGITKNPPTKNCKIPFLDNGNFDIYSTTTEWSPTPANTVEHIYVIAENIYSAAGTLTALAKSNPNITSVGLPSHRMLGQGIDPYVFLLPKSGLLLNVEPAIDIADARTASDCLHADMEVEIAPTPSEYLRELTARATSDINRYLMQEDIFMRQVLKLISSRNQARPGSPAKHYPVGISQ